MSCSEEATKKGQGGDTVDLGYAGKTAAGALGVIFPYAGNQLYSGNVENGGRIRRLMPPHLRLQGFEEWQIDGILAQSDAQAYKGGQQCHRQCN